MKNKLETLVEQEALSSTFSGVVEVESQESSFRRAWGYRDRANRLKNREETRFGIASGTKGFTALGIASLLEEDKIGMDTTAYSVLSDRFPELHPGITIEQLLAHASGIGDHYDEDEIEEGVDDFILSIPVQDLVSPFDYLPLLAERSQKFEPGQKACYSNGGYVVLAMIIEQVSEQPFHQYIHDRIFRRSGMTSSGFFRSDSLPRNSALGYLERKNSSVTNVFNLPVIGSGDGGAYTNLADMKSFWTGLLSHQIVSKDTLQPMIQKQNKLGETEYGYGFWIEGEGKLIALEGYDAGVSFYSATSRDSSTMFTVISNNRVGAWPILEIIKKELLRPVAP